MSNELPEFESITKDQLYELVVRFNTGFSSSENVLRSLVNATAIPVVREFGNGIVSLFQRSFDEKNKLVVTELLENLSKILFDEDDQLSEELFKNLLAPSGDAFTVSLNNLAVRFLFKVGFKPLAEEGDLAKNRLIAAELVLFRFRAFINTTLSNSNLTKKDLANKIASGEDRTVLEFIKKLSDEMQLSTIGRRHQDLEPYLTDYLHLNQNYRDLMYEFRDVVEDFFLEVTNELQYSVSQEFRKIHIAALVNLLKTNLYGPELKNSAVRFETLEFPRLESLT